jgi:hypothetical protein
VACAIEKATRPRLRAEEGTADDDCSSCRAGSPER